MHIVFFCFITCMYIYIWWRIHTYSQHVLCIIYTWKYQDISYLGTLSTPLTHIPPLIPLPPPPKKNPRRTKNIHLCNWFFWFSLNQEKQKLHTSFCCFFFLLTWCFEICISMVTEEEIITSIKKIKNGNLGIKLFRKWPSIPILCTDVNLAINLWKEL